MRSGPVTGAEKRHSWPGAATSCNSGSRRLEGPLATPATKSGTESTGGIYDLAGRLERLAFPTESATGAERAPLETYTVTTSEHGDVYRATDEYVRWFRSRYPGAGVGDRVKRKSPDRAPETVGKRRWKQHAP